MGRALEWTFCLGFLTLDSMQKVITVVSPFPTGREGRFECGRGIGLRIRNGQTTTLGHSNILYTIGLAKYMILVPTREVFIKTELSLMPSS